MTDLCTEPLQTNASALPRSRIWVRPLQVLIGILAAWQVRNESRARLRRMPDHLLRDIGLCAEDVVQETRKPFWLP